MKINKKINYSRIVAGYLFLSTLAIFIGSGAGLCLANTADVNNSNDLERAIGDSNIATINIEADSIALDRELPVIKRKLTISGKTDRKSILGGNNVHRILEFNPSLGDITINNIIFQNGNNKDPHDKNNGGGAIHIEEGTAILFNNVDFSSNKAAHDGGAIYSRGNFWSANTLVFKGRTIFTDNKSIKNGGAISTRDSKLTFGGETTFEKNKSETGGGAINFFGGDKDKNTLIFNDGAIFADNESTNGDGGAVRALHLKLTFGGEAKFENNRGGNNGGAIYSYGDRMYKSTLTFSGRTIFANNKTTKGKGGAMYAEHSDLIFDGEVKFEKNISKDEGGAIYSEGNTGNKNAIKFNSIATFVDNKNNYSSGGAIYAELSNLFFGREAKFENNVSTNMGGAIYAKLSHLTFSGEAQLEFNNNRSKYGGGAIYSEGDARNRNTLGFTGKTTFSGNISTDYHGGAIYAELSNLFFYEEAKFENNVSKNVGGAIYAKYSKLTFYKGAKFENNRSGYSGGAIYADGEAGIRNTFVFRKTVFAGNVSANGSGGAIYAKLDLNFDGDVEFKNNSSSISGGAIMLHSHDGAGSTVLFGIGRIATFIGNNSTNAGGAINSLGGNGQYKNTFVFKGETTFAGNGSANGSGGAIYAKLSDLTFGGEAIFVKNNSKKNGGAIYSEGEAGIRNTLIFNSKATFTRNGSADSGGAIYAKLSDLTFGREVIFENNNSKNDGGAVLFIGDSQNKRTLGFNGGAIFAGNRSADGVGGAIYAWLSDLTFGGEVKFENNSSSTGGAIMLDSSNGVGSTVLFEKAAIFSGNSSTNRGGAIQSLGNAQNKNTFEFRAETIFSGNRSTKSDGGAIYAWYTDLGFGKDVTFENNSSLESGGAISLNNNCRENAVNAIFNGLATFERNSSARGGAIYLGGNVNMTFNSGLKLINSITGEEESGAIHMAGENNSMARITIVQKDPNQLTELRGNISNNGQGHNAFYLQKHAELNFTAENGNIDLYDAIVGGDRNKYTNATTVAVAINEGTGWFNVKQGGSIANVNLTNRGNLNLAESQIAAKPLSFINSGKITFEIFPGNNICSRIQAENIALEEGTTLEISAAEGNYTAGSSYDIMVSNNVIKKPENINIILPQRLPEGLIAKTRLVNNRLYRVFIDNVDENNIDGEDNDEN